VGFIERGLMVGVIIFDENYNYGRVPFYFDYNFGFGRFGKS
jgi:hypothetical protein